MRGTKTFIYPFTINKAGTYTLPALSFSFFDPTVGEFRTMSSKAIELTVSQGKKQEQLTTLPVRTSVPAVSFSTVISQNKWIIAGGAGLLLIVGLVFFYQKKKQVTLAVPDAGIAPVLNQSFDELPKKPLQKAEECLKENDGQGFYKSINADLRHYLSSKLHIPVEELSNKKINEAMDKCNVGIGTSVLLDSLLKDIEWHLYTPVANVDHMEDVFEKASEVVALLEKQC